MTTVQAPTRSLDQTVVRFLAKAGVVVYLLAFVAVFGLSTEQFLTVNTLLAIISASSPLMVVVAGTTHLS
jgi:ribose/xylose/arabinose/galactoside ABC-type transport system permease subunit